MNIFDVTIHSNMRLLRLTAVILDQSRHLPPTTWLTALLQLVDLFQLLGNRPCSLVVPVSSVKTCKLRSYIPASSMPYNTLPDLPWPILITVVTYLNTFLKNIQCGF
ncbi:hypothetical protein J6590_039342 [Homalodisca vitripennis]|nr:hypothetical protein J6590_039342 [Homalodisca vitripennis]